MKKGLPSSVLCRWSSTLWLCVPGASTSAQTAPVALIRRDIETIHYRHSACQLTVRLNIHIVLAPVRSDRGIERNRHRNRIGQRDAVFSGLLLVGFAGAAVALDGETGNCVLNS